MNPKAFFTLALLAVVVGYVILSYSSYSARKRAEVVIQSVPSKQQLVDPIQSQARDDVSNKIDQLRQFEQEIRERERQATKKAMEDEPMLEMQAAQERFLARQERDKREEAWQNYYKPPESCIGTLAGEVSNRCLQQKLDAKKEFLRQYKEATER